MGIGSFDRYDRIIIGAGLYGLYAARFCGKRGERVLVLEYDDKPFKRATHSNQARVHMGYHYPRSLSTALKSAGYYRRFHEDYGFSVMDSFRQIYAVSSQFSWTNAEQFQEFCRSAGIDCRQEHESVFFQKGTVDGAFLTQEDTYDAMILRDYFVDEISTLKGVEIVYGARLKSIRKNGDVYEVYYDDRSLAECGEKQIDSSFGGSGAKQADGSIWESGTKRADGSFAEFGARQTDSSFGGSGTKRADGSFAESGTKRADSSFGESGAKQADGSIWESGTKRADSSFGESGTKQAVAGFVLNATYASCNQVLSCVENAGPDDNFDLFTIKYELCEIILCRPSEALRDYGFTVMDGPFFSIMPFGKTGLHSLTSVTFTPHMTSYDPLPVFSCQQGCECDPRQLCNCNDCPHKPESAWEYMRHLADKYLLPEYGYEYDSSLFSIKPILKSSEVDDSRPTTIVVSSTGPTFISVLSGKINTVYDLDEFLV